MGIANVHKILYSNKNHSKKPFLNIKIIEYDYKIRFNYTYFSNINILKLSLIIARRQSTSAYLNRKKHHRSMD